MKLRGTAGVLVAILLAQPELIRAQQSNDPIPESWRAVKSISTASDLVVKLKSGKTMKANYVSATDEAITLSQKNTVSQLPRDSVAKIQLIVRRKSASKVEMVGVAVGAAFGVGIAIVGAGGGPPPLLATLVVALLFAGLGAALAAVFSPKYKRVLIYDAGK